MSDLYDAYIPASTVISDKQRLAFDGYKLIDTDTEAILRLTLVLEVGQQRLYSCDLFQAVRNRHGEIIKELKRPVWQAIVHYLNAGGDALELESEVTVKQDQSELCYFR